MRVANLQYTARASEADTLTLLRPMIADASTEGATLIALPECATIMTADRARLIAEAATEADSRSLDALRNTATRHGCWLLIGSLLLKAERGGKMVNRSFLIAPDGGIAARYDKIHMFDAEIGDGQRYRESDHYQPGKTAVLAQTPLGRIGLTICYDLRFPALFQALAQAGAELITIPSAFTKVTGQAHWMSLLRARAIETGCFIIAPAQTGTHDGGRQTWGHSLIINPWGDVLADGGRDTGISLAEIDRAEVAEARRRIPAITTGRPFRLVESGDEA